jgi:hypothetical protein
VFFELNHWNLTESSRSAACCRSLQSTYYEQKARQADPTGLPARTQRDTTLRLEIERVWRANRLVYGAKKVWKQVKREKIAVARCTVARLMRTMGLRGVIRGRRVRPTSAADECAGAGGRPSAGSGAAELPRDVA